MSASNNNVTYFAKTNFRDDRRYFGLLQKDRLYHFYALGMTGSGKTTLLHKKIMSDIHRQEDKVGLLVVDVHGDLIANVLRDVPDYRKSDLIHLDARDPHSQLGYNPLRRVSYEKRALVASNILEVFQRVWGNQGWGVKVSHLLRYIILTLLDQKSSVFSDVLRLLSDADFRNCCVKHIVNPDVKRFWEQEFPNYSSKTDLIPIYNKIGGLLSYPSVKRILIENQQQISLRRIMDQKKILLLNLSKGAIGSEASYILGSLLLTSLASSAFSRIDTPEHERTPFFVYLDEFQNYTNLSLVELLSELRKFKVSMIMAHQYVSQLDPKIRDAVLGNVGSIACFRLGYDSARIMEKIFHPVFSASDFMNLANYDMYLKLMIYGTPSQPFSATTVPHHS
ncbi:ATP-binding protein [Muricauda sp. SCSIO 64092]|uniref:type IV secretory system conjugative DNA transfer family protein n=1 Tax=Allomuricauda sp. SCSIO 64092 TaxID=2908842 RepID=UPI001FF5EA5B|nr:type IV secretion system DNA-binding domain-containing protein [Muricauda sp. SCSIO 64092]UOY05006.1 ATP-binding protein [Muricauda sp. SCSIO 64092]